MNMLNILSVMHLEIKGDIKKIGFVRRLILKVEGIIIKIILGGKYGTKRIKFKR